LIQVSPTDRTLGFLHAAIVDRATNDTHDRFGARAPGVICVLWDGAERVTWIRSGEVKACE
jgi:hypothetical protein